MLFTRRHFVAGAVFAACAAPVLPAQAAGYPERPITLVVAFTPGGPSDVLARIVGRKMGELLGKTFVIENKPGAGGNIAAEFVARANPDGYTLLMGNNSSLATNESLYKSLKYSPEKRFHADHFGRHAGQHPGGQSKRAGAFAEGTDRAL
jgi:tripartite-type tricarboxylate transporter receptor subunit TctC